VSELELEAIIDAETPNVTYDCTIPRDRAILIEGITEFYYYGQGGPGGQVVRIDEDLKYVSVYGNILNLVYTCYIINDKQYVYDTTTLRATSSRP